MSRIYYVPIRGGGGGAAAYSEAKFEARTFRFVRGGSCADESNRFYIDLVFTLLEPPSLFLFSDSPSGEATFTSRRFVTSAAPATHGLDTAREPPSIC